MKKWIACLVILCLLAAVFTGCGKEAPAPQETVQQANENEQQPTAVPEAEQKAPEEEKADGALYDAGNVTVLVPGGWKAFPEADVFAEEDGVMNPDVLNVSKGGQTEADLFTKPYIRINYFGPSIQMGKPDASWYEDVKDVEPFTAGDHRWYGFTCDSLGTDLAILWCEEGNIQYQASIFLGSGDDTISHEDADVQAILASVMPSDPNAATMEAEPSVLEEWEEEEFDSFWDGQWYGWWCIQEGFGVYEQCNGIAWDLYAEIEDYQDGTGYLTMWDSETSTDVPLVRGYVNLDGKVLTSDYCTFYDGGEWLPDVFDVQSMDFDDWYVDAEDSSVSHFDNMIEIIGYYEDPNRSEDNFVYYMYLRPWDTRWDDVAAGDTSGCIYSDMMPVIYDDWYLPLLELGVEELPNSIAEGFALIENGAESAAVPEGDGQMTLDQLRNALDWVKSNQSYDRTYEEIAAGIGVGGLYVDEFENGGKTFCRYRWLSDEDNRITITFEKHDDGSLTWNVTTWDGID